MQVGTDVLAVLSDAKIDRRSAVTADSVVCLRCKRRREKAKINTEARIHHGARAYECTDRKDCERARRRAERKSRTCK